MYSPASSGALPLRVAFCVPGLLPTASCSDATKPVASFPETRNFSVTLVSVYPVEALPVVKARAHLLFRLLEQAMGLPAVLVRLLTDSV